MMVKLCELSPKFIGGLMPASNSLRITPIIWFGGLYQEPLTPAYEELSDFALFSLYARTIGLLRRKVLCNLLIIGAWL